jgi:hypothetical protein
MSTTRSINRRRRRRVTLALSGLACLLLLLNLSSVTTIPAGAQDRADGGRRTGSRPSP